MSKVLLTMTAEGRISDRHVTKRAVNVTADLDIGCQRRNQLFQRVGCSDADVRLRQQCMHQFEQVIYGGVSQAVPGERTLPQFDNAGTHSPPQCPHMNMALIQTYMYTHKLIHICLH